MFQRTERLANLVRYHRPSQFAWRFLRTAQRHIGRRLQRFQPCEFSPAELLDGADQLLVRLALRRQRLFASRWSDQSFDDVAKGRFSFLGQSCDLAVDGLVSGSFNWQPDQPRLWLFHLQSQEYLLPLAMRSHECAAWTLVSSWLNEEDHQSPYSDPDAWHPFCISRRLPVWLMLAAISPPTHSIADSFWRSVAAQTAWLRSHLERDLGGNHLLENLRALVLVDGCTADEHAHHRPIMSFLLDQLDLQVLSSGEHFERTPTYHSLMQLALLEMGDVIAFSSQTPKTQLEPVDRIRCATRSMADFLESILHPDGDIPLLGDSVFHETPDPRILIEQSRAACRSNEIGGEENPASAEDYWVWRDDGDFLLMDCGPIGCDSLPAHAHADLFHLEASVGGQRLLVDTGTFDYEDSAMRASCRSTAAHNTLQVGEADHADMWSRFRVGRRGHPVWKRSGAKGELTWCAAAHDAYHHLGIDRVVRLVAALPGPQWLIVDWVSGQQSCTLLSRLHFHPNVDVRRRHENILIQCGERSLALSGCNQSELNLDVGTYCPDFGVQTPRPVAVGTLHTTSNNRWLGWELVPEGCADPYGVVDVRFDANRCQVDWGKHSIEVTLE